MLDASYIETNETDNDYYKGVKKVECITNPENIWSDINNICINKNAKCGDLKYKQLCNYRNDCHWQSIGSHIVNENDLFERGYCNNIKSKELERIIDIVHRREMDKLIKIKDMTDNINKFKTQIKK